VNDDRLRQAYARHLATRATAGRDGCVAPEALLALVERTGTEADRLATLDHAMACDACRRDLELLRSVVRADGSLARRGLAWWGAPQLAAAAVLLIVAGTVGGMLLRGSDGARFRGPPDVVLVSPIGDVAATEPVTLTWRAVPGTIRYDLDLLTAGGDSVFVAQTTDTAIALRLGGRLVPGGEYVWSVRALRMDGSQAAAEPRRFRLLQP
jgi:hypothetical protein